MAMRFRIEPRDVTPVAAARRLGLTEAQFATALPALLGRGFPPADPDTGNFDLKAVDEWMDRRHGISRLEATALDASAVVGERLKAFRHG